MGHWRFAAIWHWQAGASRQWAEVIGAPHIQRMRRDLVRVLSGASGELPPVRPTW